MKLTVSPNSTNRTVYVFILDSSSTVGAGLTGLTYASGSLVCWYIRESTNPTQITLAAQTVGGGWVSGGFVEVSSTNMPGIYRLDIPNAVLASGASHAVIMLKGATNMAPVSLEIQLGINCNITHWNGYDIDPAFSDGTIGVTVTNTVNANLIAWNNSPVANLDSQGFIPAHLVSTDGVMIRANVVQWNSNDIARSDYPGYPKVTIKSGTGAGELNISSGSISGLTVDNAAIADAVWDELRVGHVISGSFGEGIASVQGNVAGSVASVSGNVNGNVLGYVNSVANKVRADVYEWSGVQVAPLDSSGHIPVITTITNTVNANLIAWNNSPVANLDSDGFIPAHLVSTDGVMINANVVQWNSNDVARSDYPGYPKVTIKSGTNTGELNINGGNLIGSVGSVTNTVDANVIQVLGVTVTETVADVNVVKFNGVAVDPAFSDGTIGVSVANTVTANVISWNGVTVDPAFSDGTIGVSITGTPAVNVTQWNGDSVPTSNVAGIPKIDLIYINGSTATESSTLSANVTQWNGVTVDPAFSDGTIGVSVSNTVNANLIAWNNSPVANLDSQGFIPAHLVSTDGVMIRANVVQWNSNDIARSDYPGYPKVTIKSGTGAGELNISSGSISGLTVDNAAIADAVWDELRSGHVTAGSFGEGVASVQGSITGSVASVSGNVSGSVASVTGNIGGSVSGSVASVTGNINGNVLGYVNSVANKVRADVYEWSGVQVAPLDSSGHIPVITTITNTVNANLIAWNNSPVANLDSDGFIPAHLVSTDGVMIRANVVQWNSNDVARSDYPGYPKVTIKSGTGAGELNISSGVIAGLTVDNSAIADAVWDELRSGHVTAGSFGEGVASVQGNVTGSVASVSGNVSGNVSGSVASIASGGITSTSFAASAIDANALAADAATEIATTLMKLDMSSISGESARSMLNALRKLMNKIEVSGATLTVYKENDSTSAWTQTLTTSSSAVPIISADTN